MMNESFEPREGGQNPKEFFGNARGSVNQAAIAKRHT